MSEVALTLNGRAWSGVVPEGTTLAELLREHVGLTGTKIACAEGTCGSCTVLVDGRAVLSCILLAPQAEGCEVTTIEGLAGGAPGAPLHPVQKAFHEMHGLQCGFCTPGMIMASIDLIQENPDPSDSEVREGIEGNLCRCTGYQNIVAAVQAAGRAMSEGASA